MGLFALLFWLGSAYAQEPKLDTTIVINTHKFHIKTSIATDEIGTILTIKRDSRIIQYDSLGQIWRMKLNDFDSDGFPDISIGFGSFTNIYYSAGLLLFDTITNDFINVAGFENCEGADPLKANRHYYYSYQKTGCADNNWYSVLFTLKDFKMNIIGTMDGEGCDKDSTKWVISIYKGSMDKQDTIPIEQIPYSKAYPGGYGKFNFIDKYWNTNYKKFL